MSDSDEYDDDFLADDDVKVRFKAIVVVACGAAHLMSVIGISPFSFTFL